MQDFYTGVSRPFAMRNYGIVTLPVVAAMLVCGLLTTHASAKAVVGRRSVPPSNELRLFAPEDLLRADGDGSEEEDRRAHVRSPHNPSTLVHFLHNLESGDDNKRKLLAMLRELNMRLGPSDGNQENSVGHKTWDKRLEVLGDDGAGMVDHGVLEARRRMGPEFNPTGW